jgi:hypothetical protein
MRMRMRRCCRMWPMTRGNQLTGTIRSWTTVRSACATVAFNHVCPTVHCILSNSANSLVWNVLYQTNSCGSILYKIRSPIKHEVKPVLLLFQTNAPFLVSEAKLVLMEVSLNRCQSFQQCTVKILVRIYFL